MALKKKITKAEHEKLAEHFKGEYKEEGENFVLDIDGEEDTGALKRALDREKQEAKDAKKALGDMQKKLDELDNTDARKRGDIETLEKSWKTKLETREAELSGKIEKLQGATKKSLLVGTADKLASEISTVPALMAKVIRERLHVDFDGEEPSLKVLDVNGLISALTIDELKKEFLTNKDYASIITGSKASGGGASGADKKGGGAAPDSKIDFSKEKPADFAARLKEKIEANK
jgi:hypothetical protein